MLLASTPTTSDYVRSRTRDHSMSPSCRTPPARLSSYDSPMLTPSPLRNQSNRQLFISEPVDQDDIFLQSPFKSPTIPPCLYPTPKPIEDDDGGIFLASSSSHPLRTPVKHPHRTALSVKQLNSQPPKPTLRVPKRKSTPLPTNFSFTTPLSQRTFTPLPISQASKTVGQPSASGVTFDRLAPLPAPRFTARTPQSKAETDVYLRRHTESMTRLRICDLNDSSGEEEEGLGFELGSKNDTRAKSLFSGSAVTAKPSRRSRDSSSEVAELKALLANAGKDKEKEVVEDISPGGHINKRRARSRPVSWELLESVTKSPSPSQTLGDTSHARNTQTVSTAIAFPTLRSGRTSTSSSPTEAGSPVPRRRVSGTAQPILSQQQGGANSRAPMNRLTSGSSATLFFGPAINDPPGTAARSRKTSNLASPASGANLTVNSRRINRLNTLNRHSYAGPGLSPRPFGGAMRSHSPSPISSPAVPYGSGVPMSEFDDEDEDMFFGGPQDSSFVFSVTEGTPSPRSGTRNGSPSIPKKYKPRDSGVVLSDYEDGGSDLLNVMPRASTSVGSFGSDADDRSLVTPGFVPSTLSGWPHAVVVHASDGPRGEGGVDMNEFIMRTLAAGGAGDTEKKVVVPGTPVKKVRAGRGFGAERPWQSAVAAKVSSGFGFGFGGDTKGGKGKEKSKPRKSMPAAFPLRGGKGTKLGAGSDTEEEDGDDDELSPSARRYEGIGLGRPESAAVIGPGGAKHWLMRRSSSGAFSAGSGSGSEAGGSGTPTRVHGRDWQLPSLRVSKQQSPLKPINTKMIAHPRKLGATQIRASSTARAGAKSSDCAVAAPALPSNSDEGRFERDFIEVGEAGSGEFGKVMKVRYKDGNRRGKEGELSAVKKSKRFEGIKHRLRLREEVDILVHLSRTGHHPNVLAYIDSWEQDEALYIQTELCELGNFARFLWEFGKAFPRLDEPRVWKIFVDLSSGLAFIHESGVIHLDLKPANIFVTGEGRFKIGDFGMASVWPRRSSNQEPNGASQAKKETAFEREGDKVYLAPEVLQGQYGKAADIFSFGMTMLETASNIVVPDQGEPWHRLRQEDFGQVDMNGRSDELIGLIKSMMRTNPMERIDIDGICGNAVVRRARTAMERTYREAKAGGRPVFAASPLGGVEEGFLEEILGRIVGRDGDEERDEGAMDLSP